LYDFLDSFWQIRHKVQANEYFIFFPKVKINLSNMKTFYVFIWCLLWGGLLQESKAQKFEKDDRVEVRFEKDQKWYAATIKEVRADGYWVGYDGYAASYDELVPLASPRLRPLNTEIAGVKAYIKAKRGQEVSLKGNLRDGKVIPLEWAQLSTMACFPGTRFQEFQGAHVFYWMDLPQRSEVTITVKPLQGKRINVYAYSGFDGRTLPPQESSCVSCEAGYEQWSAAKPPSDFSKAAGSQQVRLRAVNQPYRVLIGVAGAEGVQEGDFELKVRLSE
jgi:hypothetical protein